MSFVSWLDPILNPLLLVSPFWGILIISTLISLMITLIYKKFTDQDLMKRLKSELKELQAEIKTLRDKPDEAMKVQKQMMDTNMKYMMQSFKPTLITFIPIIIVFAWLNAHMAYDPILVGEPFSATIQTNPGVIGDVNLTLTDGLSFVEGEEAAKKILNNKAEWAVMGSEAGRHAIEYQFQGRKFTQEVTVVDSEKDRAYSTPVITRKENKELLDVGVDSLSLSYKKVQPLQEVPIVRSIPWVGGWGWLGTYILLSIITSIAFRRLFKIY